MNKLKSVFRRFNYFLKHGFLSIENVVLLIAVIMCFTWTYQSIAAMSRNWELVERLSSEQKSLELLKMEVEMAELENIYYDSEEYKEIAARKHAGKQLPGEHMVYLEENTEEAKNKHNKEQNGAVDGEERKEEYSNFEKWMRFLLP